MFERSKELTGQRFGKLVAMHREGKQGKHVMWRFQCDCGNTTVARGANVGDKKGAIRSCGCLTGFEDLTGRRFTRWEVIERRGNGHSGDARWLCRCDCGNESEVDSDNLRGGTSKSCGCITRTQGGLSETPEYNVWSNMIWRCHNPKSENYADYGGRGIKVCDQWRENFRAFLAHAGKRPFPEMSIDRIDTNGNYEPGNVRWATKIEQANNTRANVRITFEGETLTVAEMARKHGISEAALRIRLKSGMPVDEAMKTPVRLHVKGGKPKPPPKPRRGEISGKTFGELTALHRAGRQGRHAVWMCSCSCGTSCVVRSDNLLQGRQRSCGCLRTR